jgi:hypothetical protein
MKKQTAVEWLVEYVHSTEYQMAFGINYITPIAVDQAKKIEIEKMEYYKNQQLKYQLFIGKVIDVIGFEKTTELLRESYETIDQANNGNSNL